MKCPKCENEEFAYVEAKKPKVKFLWKAICIGVIILAISFISAYNIPVLNTICSIAATLALSTFIGILIYQRINRSVTHTKAICKNCNHVEWIK